MNLHQIAGKKNNKDRSPKSATAPWASDEKKGWRHSGSDSGNSISKGGNGYDAYAGSAYGGGSDAGYYNQAAPPSYAPASQYAASAVGGNNAGYGAAQSAYAQSAYGGGAGAASSYGVLGPVSFLAEAFTTATEVRPSVATTTPVQLNRLMAAHNPRTEELSQPMAVVHSQPMVVVHSQHMVAGLNRPTVEERNLLMVEELSLLMVEEQLRRKSFCLCARKDSHC